MAEVEDKSAAGSGITLKDLTRGSGVVGKRLFFKAYNIFEGESTGEYGEEKNIAVRIVEIGGFGRCAKIGEVTVDYSCFEEGRECKRRGFDLASQLAGIIAKYTFAVGSHGLEDAVEHGETLGGGGGGKTLAEEFRGPVGDIAGGEGFESEAMACEEAIEIGEGSTVFQGCVGRQFFQP